MTPQPSVSIGRPGDIALEKPLTEMTEVEVEAARRRVLSELEAKSSDGNNMYLDVPIDVDEYKGTIRLHRASIDEDRQIGIRTAKYLQGAVGVDVKTENIAIFLALFDVCVEWETAPKWFRPREMPSSDYPILELVFGRYSRWVNNFRRVIPEEQKGNSEATVSKS